jgi:ankyrin repeat protein
LCPTGGFTRWGGGGNRRENRRGCTPLYVASEHGHVAAVEALLGGGAAVDQLRQDGVTPLMCASQQGHADVVRQLLVAVADRACTYASSHAHTYAPSRMAGLSPWLRLGPPFTPTAAAVSPA